MAARREDLPSRRLSLLEEIKDLIETHNSKQNGSENSSETAQRGSRPSQLVTRHRRVTNRGWCKIFVPFSHHFLPALLLVGGLRRRSYGAIFKQKKRGRFIFLFCVHICRLRSATSPENSFTKRQAGVKKSCFSKQSIFCRCKGKTGDFPPKIERWWRFWIAEDGLSNLIYPNPIYPAAEGYSVPFLRDAAGLGQALAYIRPLQMDLDSSAVESAEQPEQVCVSNYSN